MLNNTLVINLTHNCNLNCIFCFWPKKENYYKSIEAIEEIIKNNIDKEYIVLSWWEPLLHKDINEIIKLIYKKYNKKIILHTNWILLDNNFLNLNKNYIYRINLPLDSLNKKNTIKLRWKFFYEIIKDRIFLVKKFNIKFSITTVFTSINQNDYKELIDFINDINPILWRVFEFKLIEKNKDFSFLKPSKDKIKEFIEYAKQHLKIKRFEFIDSESNFYKNYKII